MPRTYHTFDLIIIGGGTAGLSALKEARQHTQNVVLVQDGPTGTTCSRTGCMPSKALIHAAQLYHERHRMKQAGIRQSEFLYADIPLILTRVREKRDYFVETLNQDIERLRPNIIQGHGRIASPTTVRVDGKLLHAKAIVIATGSSPYIPEDLKPFADKIITTDTLFEQETLPKRIAVIGLGPVGLEMAQALARLDLEVIAIEQKSSVGGVADRDINFTICSMLKKDMRLWLDCKPEIQRLGKSLILKSEKESAEVDALLVTVGRKPNLGTLGLKKVGAQMDDEGVPYFNRHTMQLKDLPIYIAGDASDESAVLHEAADEGKRAAYYALTGDKEIRQRQIPMTIIFTHPTIAIIGDTHYAMRWNGVKIGEATFQYQGRAMIENMAYGKIRIAADADDGKLRGCEMMAPEGEHLAHLIALAMEQRLTAEEMLHMPFYHPTVEEGLKKALQQLVIHK